MRHCGDITKINGAEIEPVRKKESRAILRNTLKDHNFDFYVCN